MTDLPRDCPVRRQESVATCLSRECAWAALIRKPNFSVQERKRFIFSQKEKSREVGSYCTSLGMSAPKSDFLEVPLVAQQ